MTDKLTALALVAALLTITPWGAQLLVGAAFGPAWGSYARQCVEGVVAFICIMFFVAFATIATMAIGGLA